MAVVVVKWAGKWPVAILNTRTPYKYDMQRTTYKQASWSFRAHIPCTQHTAQPDHLLQRPPRPPAEHDDGILWRSDIFLRTVDCRMRLTMGNGPWLSLDYFICTVVFVSMVSMLSCRKLKGSGTTTHKHHRPASQQACVFGCVYTWGVFCLLCWRRYRLRTLRHKYKDTLMNADARRIKGWRCANKAKNGINY